MFELILGLTLTMYLEYAEYLSGYTEGKGLRVAIHPYKTMPFVTETGISVHSGHATFAALKMVSSLRWSFFF